MTQRLTAEFKTSSFCSGGDCVEVGLRVFDPAAASEPDAGTSGRDYMVRRLERVRAAERLGQDMEELAANAKAARDRLQRSKR